jgi:hypothetical protein
MAASGAFYTAFFLAPVFNYTTTPWEHRGAFGTAFFSPPFLSSSATLQTPIGAAGPFYTAFFSPPFYLCQLHYHHGSLGGPFTQPLSAAFFIT